MTFAAAILLATSAYFPPPDSQGGWRRAQAPAGVDLAFEHAKRTTKHGGLLVVHKGSLIYERYFGRGHPEATPNLASCGKSFTSIAAGILMHERRDVFPNGLDQKVYNERYLPADAFPLDDARKRDITLGQLLAMTAGVRGNNPSYVNGEEVTLDPPGPDGWQATTDAVAFRTPLWCAPGGGYSYATASIHIVSAIVRKVAGRELQSYIEEKLARPMAWGRWGYGYRRKEMTHTPGGGGIAMRPADVLRFAYMLLREGRWTGRQIAPAEYVRRCATASPYNPHYSYSLQFDVNTNGRAPSLPRDAYWKTGSGGHCIYVVPSLDLAVFKLGGRDEQYNLAQTNAPPPPLPLDYDGSRDGWKASVDGGYEETLRLVIAAITSRSKPGTR